MPRKKINWDLIKAIDLKVEVRRLRRQAREEVRMAKKAGAVFRDEKTLDIKIRDDQWLLEHQANIRRAVQAQAKIVIREKQTFAEEIVVDYDVYKQAQENVAKYNRKVDAWNKYHAEEIKAGTLEKRTHKRWSVATRPEETQETADVWFTYLNKNYAPSMAYGQGKWSDYVTNIMKAVIRRAPNGMDWIIEFFDRNLPSHIPQHETDYFNFHDYYVTSGEDRFKAYRELAERYGLAQEWHDLMLQHKDEVDEFISWI